MLKKIKEIWDKIMDWWYEETIEVRTHGEGCLESFFAGFGWPLFVYWIVILVYCFFTKQKAQITFTKK